MRTIKYNQKSVQSPISFRSIHRSVSHRQMWVQRSRNRFVRAVRLFFVTSVTWRPSCYPLGSPLTRYVLLRSRQGIFFSVCSLVSVSYYFRLILCVFIFIFWHVFFWLLCLQVQWGLCASVSQEKDFYELWKTWKFLLWLFGQKPELKLRNLGRLKETRTKQEIKKKRE